MVDNKRLRRMYNDSIAVMHILIDVNASGRPNKLTKQSGDTWANTDGKEYTSMVMQGLFLT